MVPNRYRSLVSANTPRGADITGMPFLWIVLLLCASPRQTSQKCLQSTTLALSLVEGSACNDVCHKLSVLLDRDKTNKVHAQTSAYLLPESGLRHLCARFVALLVKLWERRMYIRCKDLQIRPEGRVTFKFVRTSRSLALIGNGSGSLNRAREKNRAIANIFRGRYLCQVPL